MTPSVPGDSSLRTEVANVLREYLASQPKQNSPATVPRQSSARKSKPAKSNGGTKPAPNVPKPMDERGARLAKRICLACGRVVAFGIVTDKVLLHPDAFGADCIGSHRSRGSTGEPAQPDTPEARKLVGGKERPEDGKKSRKEQGSVATAKDNRTVARRTRKANSRYEDEYGGQNSVRSVSGGMPGHGKRT